MDGPGAFALSQGLRYPTCGVIKPIGYNVGYTAIGAMCSDPSVYLCTPPDSNREPTD